MILGKGKPVVEIKPVAMPTQPLRPFALCVGEFIVPDGFDAPLPEDVLEEHHRHC